jgi:uncharacterized protein (UPF0276 family)
MAFDQRVGQLPVLGLGISTEYGAGDTPNGLDLAALRREHPEYAGFLEVGVDTLSGLDPHARAWIGQGLPTTYHFLDVNLDEPEDFDPDWLDEVRATARVLRPAWLCGDAGMWHFGGREPGHMLLLPPVLCDDSAAGIAEGTIRLREAVGLDVFPENPPGNVFLGNLHLLDFFALVCERADTGMLLDCAHLGIFQRSRGHAPLTALDGFPLERVVEMHVAGGTVKQHEGWSYVDDDHTPVVLDETWAIFEHLVPRCPNLRAVVFECERNPLAANLPALARIAEILTRSPSLGDAARAGS